MTIAGPVSNLRMHLLCGLPCSVLGVVFGSTCQRVAYNDAQENKFLFTERSIF